MKPAIVLGTRPEIIKMAPVVRACRARGIPALLLHTGQHYSFEMDGVFFAELGLPAPDLNLDVGSGSQTYQVAAVMSGLEPVLAEHRPDIVLVEGDTNSVLAAALAANKAGIAVGHVEAGLRSYDRRMPEETNRVLTDHVADLLFAPTERAHSILLGEGIPESRIEMTGNTVVDELLLQRRRAHGPNPLERFGVASGRFALATFHRAENVDEPARLRGILRGLAAVSATLGVPVLAALHPRTQARIAALDEGMPAGIQVVPPLGYLDFLALHGEARLMLTDSGGLQEEACCLGVPCVTLRDNTERPESVEVGANVLAGADPERIVTCAREMLGRPRSWRNPFGDGHAGEHIVERLLRA
jgi:UDP-N-acetylglucosamine 2-epimerase (non-hydrolysing)